MEHKEYVTRFVQDRWVGIIAKAWSWFLLWASSWTFGMLAAKNHLGLIGETILNRPTALFGSLIVQIKHACTTVARNYTLYCLKNVWLVQHSWYSRTNKILPVLYRPGKYKKYVLTISYNKKGKNKNVHLNHIDTSTRSDTNPSLDNTGL